MGLAPSDLSEKKIRGLKGPVSFCSDRQSDVFHLYVLFLQHMPYTLIH
jgi:hypothetical protein